MLNINATDSDYKNLLEAKRRELAEAELKLTILVRMVTERDMQIATLTKNIESESETEEAEK